MSDQVSVDVRLRHLDGRVYIAADDVVLVTKAAAERHRARARALGDPLPDADAYSTAVVLHGCAEALDEVATAIDLVCIAHVTTCDPNVTTSSDNGRPSTG